MKLTGSLNQPELIGKAETPPVSAQVERVIYKDVGGSGPLIPATEKSLGGIIVGENLKITQKGVLSVDTADNAEQDNTRPITSAAVYTQIGNIEVLLGTI